MDRETAEDIKRHFDGVAEGLRSEMQELRSEIRVGDEGLRSEMQDLRSELKRHFDVVAESLRSDIRTVAEGFVSTNERLDRFESATSDKFGELQVMIRLSFGELARRIH